MILNYIKINNLGGFKVKSGMLQHLIENAICMCIIAAQCIIHSLAGSVLSVHTN